MESDNRINLRRLPNREENVERNQGRYSDDDVEVTQRPKMKEKDLKYIAELEADNAYLDSELKKLSQNFDWSVLWQDELPSKISLWTVGMLVLQFVTIILVFLHK